MYIYICTHLRDHKVAQKKPEKAHAQTSLTFKEHCGLLFSKIIILFIMLLENKQCKT